MMLLTLIGFTLVLGKRIKVKQHEQDEDDQVNSKCSPNSCSTFDETASCSCAPHIGKPELTQRLKGTLYDVVQRVRKVVDKLTPESGTFSKLWWGGKLGDAQKELALLEESLEKVPAIQTLFDTPVKQLSDEGFEPPAGMWPVMVEIWDDNIALRRQVFIGEVGVPFKDGENHYEVPLHHNSRQWGVKPEGATVSFSTIIEKSSPYDCEVDGEKTRCVKHNVKVICHGASNLPNTDTNIFGDVTDAYCKVRVQTETGGASLKLKTEPVNNDLNPHFEATFELEPFEQALVDPVPTSTEPDARELDESELVPFTIDEMTLSEQLTAHMYNLGNRVFLNSDKCKSENTKVPAICKLFQNLGSFAVDKSALNELASSEEDPVTKKLANRLAEMSKNQDLATEEDVGSSLVEIAEMTAIRRGMRFAIGRRRR